MIKNVDVIPEYAMWTGMGIGVSIGRFLSFILGIKSIEKSCVGPPLIILVIVSLCL